MRLRGEIVNFVGTDLLDDASKPGAVTEVSVVKLQAITGDLEPAPQMIDAPGGEAGTAPYDAVNFVPFAQEKFGQVGTILSGDTGYKSNVRHAAR